MVSHGFSESNMWVWLIRAGKVAQKLQALVLVEDLGLAPSTHVEAHNQLSLQFQGIYVETPSDI